MILSGKERKAILESVQKTLPLLDDSFPEKSLLLIIVVLISDFEELEKLLTRQYNLMASGKEITELLDSIMDDLPHDVLSKIHIGEHPQLIKNLAVLIDNGQKLKEALAELRKSQAETMQ